jgi:transposase
MSLSVNEREESNVNINRVGLDLAKRVIQLHAVDAHERVVKRVALKRDAVLPFFHNLPKCTIGMEACAGAHDWARRLQALGHEVKLMPPYRVKPYVAGQKNDRNDAAAICEAMTRPTMSFVPVKSVLQQDGQALVRIRSERVALRTALINQMRGLLTEYGIVVETGATKMRRAIPWLLEDAQNGLSDVFRGLLADLYADLVALEARIAALDRTVAHLVRDHDAPRRLCAVPGIGPVTAVALVASIGNAHQFKSGRQMAAFFGLTPRQHSSGGKTRLFGMHKRGDSYLRGLLVQGARSVQCRSVHKTDSRSEWLNALAQRRHYNIATVAQANKTVRIAWALLARNETYRPNGASSMTA